MALTAGVDQIVESPALPPCDGPEFALSDEAVDGVGGDAVVEHSWLARVHVPHLRALVLLGLVCADSAVFLWDVAELTSRMAGSG